MNTGQKTQAVCISYLMSWNMFQNTKYLGVTINTHLIWELYIRATVTKPRINSPFWRDTSISICSHCVSQPTRLSCALPSNMRNLFETTAMKGTRLASVQRHAAHLVTEIPMEMIHRPSPTTGLWLCQCDPGNWRPGMAQFVVRVSGRKVEILNYYVSLPDDLVLNFSSLSRPGPVFCLMLRVGSDYAQSITGQVTEVTCLVIGQAQPELTPGKI